jgi:hypothetical protein
MKSSFFALQQTSLGKLPALTTRSLVYSCCQVTRQGPYAALWGWLPIPGLQDLRRDKSICKSNSYVVDSHTIIVVNGWHDVNSPP